MFIFFFSFYASHLDLHSFPTRRSSDLPIGQEAILQANPDCLFLACVAPVATETLKERPTFLLDEYVQESPNQYIVLAYFRSEEHTSELQSHSDLVCRLLLEKKKINIID